MKILIVPELPEAGQQDDILARLTWYLLPVVDPDGEVWLSGGTEAQAAINPPAFFDQTIAGHYARFRNFCSNVADIQTIKNEGQPGDYDAVICWQRSAWDDANILTKKGIAKAKLLVDPQTERFESSKYLRFQSHDGALSASDVIKYRDRFNQVAAKAAGQPVGIFGTGPSLDDVDGAEFAKSFNIATNSMVNDSELLDTLNPSIIVASDPIFHAGCSSYAEEFRKSLIAAVKKYDAPFVFPSRDYKTYEYFLSEISDYLIGVPLLPVHSLSRFAQEQAVKHIDRRADAYRATPLNMEMTEKFYSVVTSNVMTFFLLPIAASLSDEIVGAGFDGRDPDDNEYFWAHSKKSQYTDQMDPIKECHPAFFDIDYDEYYKTHVDTLTTYLFQLEFAGKEFKLLTRSHIPCLRSRRAPSPDIPDRSKPQISVIMPNLNGEKFLEKAIMSVIGQTYDDWELLLVDNGSTDRSLDIAASYSEMDGRVRILNCPERGVSKARNMGLDAARGEFICFLDSDDELPANSLQVRWDHLQISQTAICTGRVGYIDDNGASLDHVFGPTKTVVYNELFEHLSLHMSAVMGRAAVMKSTGFPEDLANGEDFLYFAKLLRQGYVVERTNDVVSAYRIHPFSVTQDNFIKHNQALTRVFEFFSDGRETHPFYASTAGLMTPEAKDRQTSQRIFAGLCFAVAKGDKKGATDAIRLLTEISPDIATSKPSAAWVEVQFLRALALPKGSAKLYRESLKNYALALSCAESLRAPSQGTPQNAMADALISYVRRASKVVLGDETTIESLNTIETFGKIERAKTILGKIEEVDLLGRTTGTDINNNWVVGGLSNVSFVDGHMRIERRKSPYNEQARTRVTVSAGEPNALVLAVTEISDTVTIVVNGQAIGKVGEPGVHLFEFTPKSFDAMIDVLCTDDWQATATIGAMVVGPSGRVQKLADDLSWQPTSYANSSGGQSSPHSNGAGLRQNLGRLKRGLMTGTNDRR